MRIVAKTCQIAKLITNDFTHVFYFLTSATLRKISIEEATTDLPLTIKFDISGVFNCLIVATQLLKIILNSEQKFQSTI